MPTVDPSRPMYQPPHTTSGTTEVVTDQVDSPMGAASHSGPPHTLSSRMGYGYGHHVGYSAVPPSIYHPAPAYSSPGGALHYSGPTHHHSMPPYGYGRPPPWATLYDGYGAASSGYVSHHPNSSTGSGIVHGSMPIKSDLGRGAPPCEESSRITSALSGGSCYATTPSTQPSTACAHQEDINNMHKEMTKPSRDVNESYSPDEARQQQQSTSHILSQQEMAESLQDMERVKAAAAAELSLAEVKPIQTDFHFFIKDIKSRLREQAVQEVDASLVSCDAAFVTTNRNFLINSNLNCRLLKEWEDLSKEGREVYFQKEEVDRRRFMEDDEVASRHCFTLTARARSPIKKGGERQSYLNDSSSPNEQDLNMVTDGVLQHEEEDDSPGKRSSSSYEAHNSVTTTPNKRNRPEVEGIVLSEV